MMEAGTRAPRLWGTVFSVLFTIALTALLGELIGAFADSAASFTYFDSSAERIRHALGAYFLAASGLVFIGFTVRATGPEAANARTDLITARLAATAFAAQAGLAAAALATVSLSVGFGQITGDPGIRTGEELLPQLGYVVLFVPGALSAGLAVLMIARVAARTSQLPRWVIGAGYPVAVVQLFSFYTLPLLLIPLWVLGAAISLRPATADASEGRHGRSDR